MERIYLDSSEFKDKIKSATRIWNPYTKKGEQFNENKKELQESCRYIFERDDGWSLASPEYKSAEKLWKKFWVRCYILKK